MNFKEWSRRTIEDVELQIERYKSCMIQGNYLYDFSLKLARMSQENHLNDLYEELKWLKEKSTTTK